MSDMPAGIPYGDEYGRDEYAAILAAHGRCSVYVPSPHEGAAKRGIKVPCRNLLPCEDHTDSRVAK